MIFGGSARLPASGRHYRNSISGGSQKNRRSCALPPAGYRLAQQRVVFR